MSPMFNFVKSMYEKGKADAQRVKTYVPKFITEEEYKEITGEEYNK